MRHFFTTALWVMLVASPVTGQAYQQGDTTAPEAAAKFIEALNPEIFKAGLALLVSMITLGLGWFIGLRLSARWSLWQKRKEYDLATTQEFHRLYGEFFSIWKLWNYTIEKDPEQTASIVSDLFARACSAEGAVESLMIRVVVSRQISPEEIRLMGCFRQGYQSLRESISHNRPLNWSRHDAPEYLSFPTGSPMPSGTSLGRPCRAIFMCNLPRAKALGCSVTPFHGERPADTLHAPKPQTSLSNR